MLAEVSLTVGARGERQEAVRGAHGHGGVPAGTAAGAQVSNPRCRFVVWITFSLRCLAWRNLSDSVTDMASDKRARLFPLNQCHLDQKSKRMAWPPPIRRTAYEGINWSQQKGASCCLVAGFVVVDHLWQSGGSKLD